LAIKQRTFSFTFYWPPSKEPSPSPSLFFFPGHNFQFNWENTRFRKLFEEEKND
jgi:hypothetical protein